MTAMTSKVEHIFVLMLENRSFDHMLGFLPREGHLSGVDGLSGREFNLLDAADPASQRFHVRTGAPFAMPDQLDPDHSVVAVNYQLTGSTEGPSAWSPARNDGFVENFAWAAGQTLGRAATTEEIQTVMDCFDSKELPALSMLAREFCLCDHWHADVPGPTMPNRIFVHAATSNGVAVNQFDRPFPIPTIYQRLAEAGRSWRNYFYNLNDLVQFPNLDLNADNNRFFSAFAGDIEAGDAADYTFLQPSYLSGSQPDEVDNSQHAPADVRYGEELIAKIYNAIRGNEELWRTSVLIVTYDEHGGFYDHVVPPFGVANPDGKESADPPFDFRRLGVRVPAVVVSPWIRPMVDSTVYSHSSIAATVKEHFGLPAFLTRRDATANRFTHLLSDSGGFREDTPKTLRARVPKKRGDEGAKPLSPVQRQMLMSLALMQTRGVAKPLLLARHFERQDEAHAHAKALWESYLTSKSTQPETAAGAAGNRHDASGVSNESEELPMSRSLASAIASRIASRLASRAASSPRSASASASRAASPSGSRRASRAASTAASSANASAIASRAASLIAKRVASRFASPRRSASYAASPYRYGSRAASPRRFASRGASAASHARIASIVASALVRSGVVSRGSSRAASPRASRAASPASSRAVSRAASARASRAASPASRKAASAGTPLPVQNETLGGGRS